MESEGQLQSNGVDDATRLAASNRTFTLNPISEAIVADDEPDDLIAAHHIIAPPIANIPCDEEKTTPGAVQAAIEHKNHRRALAVSSFAVIILTVGTGYLLLTK